MSSSSIHVSTNKRTAFVVFEWNYPTDMHTTFSLFLHPWLILYLGYGKECCILFDCRCNFYLVMFMWQKKS